MFVGFLKTIFRSLRAPAETPAVTPGHLAVASIQVAASQFEAGNLQRAQELAAEIARIDPQHANAWNLLGVIALAAENHQGAVRHFERAIALQPQNAAFLSNCGEACRRAGWVDDAIAHSRAAAANDPADANCLHNLGVSLLAAGEVEQARVALLACLELQPAAIAARSSLLFSLCHLPAVDGHRVLAEHVRWHQMHGRGFEPAQPPPLALGEPARKLRVGFVSADFRQHSLAYFIAPLFTHHDRTQFEFFCYSNTRKADRVTAQLRADVEQWRDIAMQSDEQVAALVASDGIDVLIDLAGHTADSRLLVFARKPAPVQITYVGYPNTTGMATMDFRISDRYMDPPGASDAMYTERLLRLPNSLWCYRPPVFAPDVNRLPASENGFITFGSPHSIVKINPRLIEIWAGVMAATPGSRLLIAGVPEGDTRVRMGAQFARHGVESSRVEMLGRLNFDDYFKFYHRVDVVLDAFPYAGGTTTCEALWMGVPVMTLAGEYGASRAGVSLLTVSGLTEWVADDAAQFTAIAMRLSGNLGALSKLRASLRQRLRQSALMDEAGFTRAFENLLMLACRTVASHR